MRRKWIFWAPLGIVALALFVFVGGEVVKLLWNWLVPPLFGWRQLTFWQALGLLALCRILFGGFGFRSSGRSRYMSREERERFRHGSRERFGGPSMSESTL